MTETLLEEIPPMAPAFRIELYSHESETVVESSDYLEFGENELRASVDLVVSAQVKQFHLPQIEASKPGFGNRRSDMLTAAYARKIRLISGFSRRACSGVPWSFAPSLPVASIKPREIVKATAECNIGDGTSILPLIDQGTIAGL